MIRIGVDGGLRNCAPYRLPISRATPSVGTAYIHVYPCFAAYSLSLEVSSFRSISSDTITRSGVDPAISSYTSLISSCWLLHLGHHCAIVSTSTTLPLKSLIVKALPVFTSV